MLGEAPASVPMPLPFTMETGLSGRLVGGGCRGGENQEASEEASPGFGGSTTPPMPEKEVKVN